MDQLLIFGGLSPFGYPITKYFLDEGVNVVSMSSAVTEQNREQEEENAFFLGRNALFHRQDEAKHMETDCIILADTLRMDTMESRALKEKINALFSKNLTYQRLVFLSYRTLRENDEEKTIHDLESIEGLSKDAMESFFISLLREMKRKEAVIIRTHPDVLTIEEKSASMVRLIHGVLEKDHEGLDLVPYVRCEDAKAQSNDKMRSLLPDDYIKWL
ncbi:hypothetical protein ACFP7A_03675 [Sporolactobacillus kofuensis]|uniref:Uncharacterized protein n=1 Tax=Sporolactobacillus kofuensis TaxID=269672 RepID=A0ABW1WDS7_9BACL|nr:hypothetical protein [Sporolactobacillus kofuensis]MCO7174500.1 hypothetical protein [Sporolactobacillus kofuensis]